MVSGRFWRFKLRFAWPAQGFWDVAKYVAGAGIREGSKNVGRHGGFEEVSKRCFSCSQRRDFVLSEVLGRWICGRVAAFMSRKCYFAGIISRGSYRSSYASAQPFRGRRSTFEASTSKALKSLKRIVILRVKCLVDMSFLKEVPQKCFGFELQSFIFERSLAEKLCLGFEVPFLKEVLQKSFVFCFFKRSLAGKLGFWASKFHFWRKSRTEALFLNFEATFLIKGVSQTSFVLEFPSQASLSGFHFHWIANQLNLTSIKSQINGISKQLNLRSFEFETISNQWNL